MYEEDFEKWFCLEEKILCLEFSDNIFNLKKAYVAGAEMMKKKIVNEANGPIPKQHKMCLDYEI